MSPKRGNEHEIFSIRLSRIQQDDIILFLSRIRKEHVLTFVFGFCVASLLASRSPPVHYQLQVQSFPDKTCSNIVPNWIWQLHRHENRIYSQSGEDGITEQLIQRVPLNNKFYVEFGTESAIECNTRILREKYRWKGLLMDGSHQNTTIGLQKESVHPGNIVGLFQKYKVPQELDYLSIDTDYADFWIWKAVLEAGYRPKLVVGEINSNFQASESATVHAPPSNAVRYWKSLNNYFGVSALALKRLWNKHGYTMVYCGFDQINCWGVRTDLLNLKSVNNASSLQECLWRKPLAYHRKLHAADASKETFSWVNEAGDVASENYVASFSTVDFVQWQKQTEATYT